MLVVMMLSLMKISDFYLAHELIFSGPAGSESAPQPIASFPLPSTPLGCETIMATHSLSFYSQSLSGRSSNRQHKHRRIWESSMEDLFAKGVSLQKTNRGQ